ncbi:hypothetical protein HRM2_42510 [Desulforapulum autotrophicum HRM2]|uniref:Uncharacterized protein n=1 Tax=Desulforapulum autotrophicum (strain ATCC 43914 / DSM 3382 / VKM B-1955 / HRM2) TaxID=177437 RepID=C0QD75_DESAH|nr:hypothetical protein HRM2_42510 [Desulforapulum autotrophicum HRM2]
MVPFYRPGRFKIFVSTIIIPGRGILLDVGHFFYIQETPFRVFSATAVTVARQYHKGEGPGLVCSDFH